MELIVFTWTLDLTITEKHEPLNYQIAPIGAGVAPDLVWVRGSRSSHGRKVKAGTVKKIPVALLVKIKFLDKIQNLNKVYTIQ